MATACSSVQRFGSLYVRIDTIIAVSAVCALETLEPRPLKRLFCFSRMRSANASSGIRHALAELLGKGDDDALRPAYVGQAVRVLVSHFANELGPVGAQPCNHTVDVIDGEH